MKIVSFWRDQKIRLGLLLNNEILEPALAESLLDPGERVFFSDAISFIRGGEFSRKTALRLVALRPVHALHRLDRVTLAAPILPSTILCAGSNYREHNDEKIGSPTSGKEPEFFVKTSDSVIGPDEAIQYDEKLTRKLDCETELGIVIGTPGRHISKERALEHVFGYTVVNDVTARDRQVRRSGDFTWYELGRGKAFDTSAPIGPCITTADEIPDPQVLGIHTRVNGELRQSSNTRSMIWSCADLIHFFSTNFTLKPGMVIITGTPAGTAWSADKELGGRWQPREGLVAAARYFLPGDIVECEIERIGILRNPVR
ncbi:fumarylacetoacetate hydrolase family protein [Bradyrhizobium sp.]|jgi:2-keto-4-pentenoate hydratase/2-oxohepta-3-ene-1,7-dioic acid hydratase in catechol pathway|uniref:fumarylacetoacetate hydrolase family protein n=1 Tax=Bradyrhizobium sp. TaxID=376 RepID=UPI003C1C205F